MSSSKQGTSDGAVAGWLAVPAAGVAGFVAAPPLGKVAVVAGGLAVVLVFALAHGHGMTLRAAAALYAGRAVLAVVKALAVVAVQWPLRGAHRVWVRGDAPLRAQLGAARAGDAARTVGLSALTRLRQQCPPMTSAAPAAQSAPAHDTHAA